MRSRWRSALADLAHPQDGPQAEPAIEALNGRFDDHHADLARLLLRQIDACSRDIDQLTERSGQQ